MVLIFNDGSRKTDLTLINFLIEESINYLIINKLTIDENGLTLGGSFKYIRITNIFEINSELKTLGVKFIYFSTSIKESVNINSTKSILFGKVLNQDCSAIWIFR